jgi:4-hydroxybenzoate polyprenyltransferase
MRTFIITCLGWLTRSAVLLALGAASFTCAAVTLAGGRPRWIIAAIPFCCTYAVYNFDRLADRSGTDSMSTPGRARVVQVYRGWLWGSVLGALAIGIVLAAGEGWIVLALTLAFPLSVVAYVVPLLPFERIRRLKDVPLLKSFYVPGCWCLLVLLGARLAHISWLHPATMFMFGFMYLRIFTGALVGDLRDEHADRAAGIQTLIVGLGRQRSHLLIHGVNLLMLPFIALGVLMGWIGPTVVALAPAVAFGYSVFIWCWRRPERREFLCDIYDFEFAALFPLVWLAGLVNLG